MRIIAIVNQKGGCGKTTTAINLSACLAQQGNHVLLVDLDPQGHATLGLDIKSEDVEYSSCDVLRGEVSLESAVFLSGLPNLHLVPAEIGLSVLDQELRDLPNKDSILLEAVGTLRSRYDFIILDCPPSLGLLSVNALRSCHEAIVPVDPSFFSLHGIGKLMETLELITEKTGHEVVVYALTTMVDRRCRFVQEVLEELTDHFGEHVLKSRIRMNVKLRESASFGWPITEYAKNSIGAWDYMALADEVVSLGKQEKMPEWADSLSPGKTDYAGRSISTLEGTLFVFRDPHARDVRLAGDFNDWIPDRNVVSIREKDGTWKKIVSLPSGSYQYKYWVDGEWRADPENPQVVQNPMGDVNSLLSIQESQPSPRSDAISESTDPELP